MRTLLRNSLVLACGLYSAAITQSDADIYFLLRHETVKCIASNRTEFADQIGSVIFIKPQECLTESQDDTSTYAPAEAPDTSVLQKQNDTGADALLFLSRPHLACFAEFPILDETTVSKDTIWRFYPETCQFEPDK